MRLKKSEWKGFILPVEYTSSEYYDVKIKADTSGFTAVFERKAFSVPVKHSPEAYDYPDRLFAPPLAGRFGLRDLRRRLSYGRNRNLSRKMVRQAQSNGTVVFGKVP